MWLRLGEFSSRNTERYPTPLGLRAKCSLRVVALLCCILLHLEHAHAIKFSGKYWYGGKRCEWSGIDGADDDE